MKTHERRERIFTLMQEAGALIQGADPDSRYRLWATANDDLSDAVTSGDLGLDGFREAFTDAAREFWLRENQLHSVRVEPLRLVKEEA